MQTGTQDVTTAAANPPGGGRTIFLCFLAALLEGADIVSMGLAAPKIARQFHLGPGAMSYILTAAIVGLMLGAALGGGLGDRWGRKRVLLGSFVVLATFSLATAFAGDFNAFVIIRFLAGLGLGAAFPNLITLAAEASKPARRSTGVGLMFAGQPVGGACLGLFTASGLGGPDWRSIFSVGGGLPRLLLPLLLLFCGSRSPLLAVTDAPKAVGLLPSGRSGRCFGGNMQATQHMCGRNHRRNYTFAPTENICCIDFFFITKLRKRARHNLI